MKILDFPKEGRPRERFLKLGPEALSDAELFATNLIPQRHYDLMIIEDKIEFLKRIHKEVMGEIVKKKGEE